MSDKAQGESHMSKLGAVPSSIIDALHSELGYVLVITGQPGTGKSLLVQEIFRKISKSCMILTSAENHSAASHLLEQAIPDWNERHIVSKFWEATKLEIDTKSSLCEQLTSILETDVSEKNSNLIIIDSWTDFIQPTDEKLRYEIQQSLVSAARAEKKKMVLVTEGTWGDNSVTTLHHTADGVITLEKIRDNQRMYRQVVIEKMRSHLINQDSFLFTLEGGRFTYIPWYVHQYPAITIESETIPDPSVNHISTGNISLDEVLKGGFSKGHLSLIEVENIAVPYVETICIPFLSNHLLLGKPALIVLPEGWSPENFTSSLTHFIDEKLVDEQVVFFGRQILGQKKNVRAIDNDPLKTLQEIKYESGQLERKFKKEVAELIALDTLENKYGSGNVRSFIAEMSAALPRTNKVTICILSKYQSVKSESIAHHIHLRVQEISGVISICGINPRTNYLAVRPILSAGYLDYDLLPIV